MKHFFHAALVLPLVMFAVSCSESDDEPKPVELTGGTTSQQTVYADDKQAPAPIRFTAKSAWTATVAEVQTKAEGGSSVDWLKLDAYSGGAGDISLNMELEENTTGHDRKAEIRIECAGTTLTITVEQKGTKRGDSDVEDPNKPENPDQPDPNNPMAGYKKLISHIEGKGTGYGNEVWTYDFTYDNQNRVEKIVLRDDETEDGKNVVVIQTVTITYGKGTVSYEITATRDGVPVAGYRESGSAKLDANGRIESGWRIAQDEEYGKFETFKSTYKLAYDDKGCLKESYYDENVPLDSDGGNEELDCRLTWKNGNLTESWWSIVSEDGNGTVTDRWDYADVAAYGSVKNNTNVDLNWMIALESEGWDFAVGDPSKIFAVLGYVGNRTENLAEKVAIQEPNPEAVNRWDYTIRYETDAATGLPTEITESSLYDDLYDDEWTTFYTITYVDAE